MYNCDRCKNTLNQREAITLINENRLYLFCCKKCRDEWVSILGLDSQLRLF